MRGICLVGIACMVAATMFAAPAVAQERPITLRVGRLLDGKGGVQQNTNIVVQGSKIVRLDPNVGVILQNYIRNKTRYLGIGNYTEEGFAYMQKGVRSTTQ